MAKLLSKSNWFITSVLFALVLSSCGGDTGRRQEDGYGPESDSKKTDTFNALTTPPDSLKDTVNGLRPGDPVQ